MADQQGVSFLDLLPALQGQKEENLWVSQQDQHPNGLACGLIAQAIKEALRKYLINKKWHSDAFSGG